jgi:hypothetical protein
MKRGITPAPVNPFPVKRPSSSLFSIETINESRPSSELNLTLQGTSSILSQDSAHERIVSISSPCATETEVSSTDGFFIDEESDDDENSTLVPTFLTGTLVQKAEECVSSEFEAKPVEEPGDLRTGIVVEAGAKHFDRHNRMHKERPMRVTSIMDALHKSDIQKKCVLLDNGVKDSSPEQDFLEDEDYLQVHLPGYMKRYDTIGRNRFTGASETQISLRFVFFLSHE